MSSRENEKVELDLVVGHPRDTGLVRESMEELLPLLSAYPSARLVVICPEAKKIESEFKGVARNTRRTFVEANSRFYSSLFQHLRRGEANHTLCIDPAIRLYATQLKAIWEMRQRVDWIRGQRAHRRIWVGHRASRWLYRKWFEVLFSVSLMDPGCPFFLLRKECIVSSVDDWSTSESFWWELAAMGSRRKWKFTELPLTVRATTTSLARGSGRGFGLLWLGVKATFGMHRVLKKNQWNRVTEVESNVGSSGPTTKAS
jgi:hypothetical protein